MTAQPVPTGALDRSEPGSVRSADSAWASETADLPTVSIIIPVRSLSTAFERCLQAIERLDPAPAEVVVAVDGGDVAVAERARASGAKVVVVPQVSGPSVARNRAAATAMGDLLFFVDADVVLPPSAVGRVLHWCAARPECSAVIGSYDETPAEQNFASQVKNLANHWYHQNAHEQASTFWAACGAVRRSAFEQVGGFDERYQRPSVEDIELGYRLRDEGAHIAVDKQLQVTHLKRWTLTSLVSTDVLRRALPWSALILRRGAADDDLNVSVRERYAAVLALVGLIAALVGLWNPSAWLVAGVCVAAQLLLDRSLLAFFARRRGMRFAVAAAPMLLAYHLYSAIAFVSVALHHLAWRSRRVRAHRSFLAVIAAFGLSALAVPMFAPVAISDDGMYSRSVETLLRDGELTVFPLSAATQIFQTAWAAMFGLVLGDDLGVFRLSTVALTGLAGWACYGLCRELGVDRGRSALGAAAYLFNPLGYALGFTFLTDAPLAALVAIAAYAYARGLRGEAVALGWLVAGSTAAAAAFLVRQQGAVVVVGVACYLVASRRLSWNRASLKLAAAAAAVPVFAAAAYYMWARTPAGLPADTAQTYAADQLAALPTSWDLFRRVTFVEAVYPGLFVLPVALAVLPALRRLARRVRSVGWAIVAAWAMVVVAGFVVYGEGPMPYFESFFTISGLGPAADLRGGRYPIMGDRIGAVLTVLCILSMLAVLLGAVRPRSFGRGRDPANDRAHLVLWLLGGQAAAVIATSVVSREASGFSRDRYLLPLLPLAVCVALWAVREVRAHAVVGWVAAAAFFAYSVAGTHDMLSRDAAVWSLAEEAVADGVALEDLDAGAGWASYHLYGNGIAQEWPELPPGLELSEPLVLSSSDVAAWWIPFYAPGLSSEYVISSTELDLYTTVRQREYSSWLRPRATHVYLVERDDSFR